MKNNQGKPLEKNRKDNKVSAPSNPKDDKGFYSNFEGQNVKTIQEQNEEDMDETESKVSTHGRSIEEGAD